MRRACARARRRRQEFAKHNVTDVVRVCNPTYSVQPLRDANITVHVRSARAAKGRARRGA